MKVAIAGAGIAGGYLARLLGQKGISPEVYDGMEHDTRCGYRSCGWGAPVGIEPYLSEVGLDLDEYLLEPMPSINFDGLVATTPLCTLDKPRLLRDLTSGIRFKREDMSPEKAEDYDIVVDATGIARAFLPPCRSDLTLPTLQHRVAVESHGEGYTSGRDLREPDTRTRVPLGLPPRERSVPYRYRWDRSRPSQQPYGPVLPGIFRAVFFYHALQLRGGCPGRIPVLFDTVLFQKDTGRRNIPDDRWHWGIDRNSIPVHRGRYRLFPGMCKDARRFLAGS